MNKHFQVGVTGGIGAGKSIVTKIFSVLGVPVYDSDSRAKQIMSEDEELISEIIAAFGAPAYDSDRHLNKSFLSDQVFNNPEALERLNQLVHPRVGSDYLKWVERQSQKLVIKEAALLFERDIAKKLNYLIVVTAPDNLRIERVRKRDGREEPRIREIMANQWTQERTSRLADSIIINDNLTPVIPQVLGIFQHLKKKVSLL